MRLTLLRLRRMVVKELRQLLRDPKSARVIFVSPLLQVILLGYAVNTDVRNLPLFVVDHDRSVESRGVTEALTASGYFEVVATSDRDGDALAALDAGRAGVALVIPPRFSSDLVQGAVPSVQLLLDGTNSNTATVAQGYAGKILARYGAELIRSGAVASTPPGTGTGAGPGIAPGAGVDLRARAAFNPGLESQVYNVPGIIATIVLMMSLLLTATGVARERELGTLDQLLVSPLTPGELMLGKTLPVALIAMIQLAVITLIAIQWFGIPFRGSAFVLLFGAALYILASLSLGLILATETHTQQEAFLGLFLIIMPAIILSGFLYPVETMPPFFQAVTLLNPLRHFLEIVRDVFLKGSGIVELWRQYAILTAMAVGGLAIATARFRKAMG
jgi:ABC-2 type transport system permease protein